MKFRYSVVTNADRCLVPVAGNIDAGVQKALAEMSTELTKNTVTLGMAGITGINSVGCKEWAAGMLRLVEHFRVEAVECPILFIDSCNLMPSLIPEVNGKVMMIKTFFAPFRCGNCRSDKTPLFDITEITADYGFPPRHCDKCNATLQPDFFAEDYLGFVARIRSFSAP